MCSWEEIFRCDACFDQLLFDSEPLSVAKVSLLRGRHDLVPKWVRQMRVAIKQLVVQLDELLVTLVELTHY